ncbi:MAG: hypothetical protein R6V58_18125 [Planctomycetota bacterium]
MNRRTRWTRPAAILLALAAPAAAVEVRLTATNDRDVPRRPAIITSGVPFAKGAVTDVSALHLSVDGKPVAAQFARTVPWDDGSVRWALLGTQLDLPARGSSELVVSDAGKNPAPKAPVMVEDGAGAVTVSTGPLVLVLGKRKPGLIRSLNVHGKDRLTGSGRGLVIRKAGGGAVVAGAPDEVRIEQAGPLRAVVCLKGSFPGVHKGLIRYTARFSAFAGRKFIKVHLWLENHGADGQGKVKPEWFAFDGMAVELSVDLGGAVTARCEGAEAEGRLKVLQLCRKGEKPPYFTDENFEYTVSSGPQELKQGKRTDGLVQVQGDAGKLTVGVRHFWQNYEKAIELDGTALRLWFWPPEGQWPRPTKSVETKWLRRLKGVPRGEGYLLPGSVHKGHELILDFSGRPAAETQAELSRPVFARASAEYYAATGALPGFFAPAGAKTGNKNCDFKLASWARMGRSAMDPESPTSLYAARSEHQRFRIGYHGDSSYWYGWMDFGDLSVPGKGQVSLHYDWPLLVLLEYLQHGDPNALEMGTQMVRHRIDIDQYWSDRDPPSVNAIQSGVVWPTFHANGRSGGPNAGGTWTAGPALWYMLTGEPKARQACLRSAEGLVRAWKAIAGKDVYGGGRKTDMAANAWAIESFCAAYDLTADRRWLDEAMKLFNTNITNKWEKHGPFLHSPGKAQIFGQGYIKEDKQYCYAIAPFCILHARTRDENVLRLLLEGCEKPLPEDSYFEAPMFLAGLYAYTGTVARKPEYLNKAAKLFALGFPESKSPPAFMPNNTTWSRRAAMMIRAGYPVQHAFWKQED